MAGVEGINKEQLAIVQAIIMGDMASLQNEADVTGVVVLAGTMQALAEMFGLAFVDGQQLGPAWDELCKIGKDHAIQTWTLKQFTGKEKQS